MKIAIYSGEIPSTTFIEGLILALASEGHQIYLFGRRRNNISYQSSHIRLYPTPGNKIALVFFVLWNRLRLLLTYPKRYRLLKAHIASISQDTARNWRSWAKYLPVILHLPDIFHIQWAKSTEEWLFLKNLFGVKIVLSLRGAHINYSPVADLSLAETYRRCFPQLDGFHGVSKAIIKEGKQYGVNPEKSAVIYSGVSPEILNTFQKNNFDMQSPVRLLSVGRFHWKKGYHYAIDAVHLLGKRGIQAHYTIIAGSTPPEELLYQVHDLNMADRVTFLPKLPQQEVFMAMQQVDCLLLPSVEEGVANVVLEALAIGLPVLSSNCGGMSEVIEHGENGFLFENRNPAHLADRIEEMIRLLPKERELLAKRGRKTIKVQHSLNQLGQEMEDLYKSALCISD